MSIIITNIDLGRKPTEAERAAKTQFFEAQIAAGTTNGQVAFAGDVTYGIRAWTTTDAANAYIDWANANYTPPPVSAVVQTI
jgi:hypothetical protein